MLDLEAIERALYDADGPAHRLMEAMASVKAQEGHNGYQGAPSLVLAVLMRLAAHGGLVARAVRD